LINTLGAAVDQLKCAIQDMWSLNTLR
jgi:hypothetical protein